MIAGSNEKAPAAVRTSPGARGPGDHCSLSPDSLATLQTQRLARSDMPTHIAAILAPVAFGGHGHG